MENTYLLIPKLVEFLGDKIACVRFSISEAIKNIIVVHRLSLKKVT